MSQKCKGIKQFRGTLNVTRDSKITHIPEGTTNTSIAQKANYKAYAVPTVRNTKGKEEKTTKIQQTPRNHIFHIQMYLQQYFK